LELARVRCKVRGLLAPQQGRIWALGGEGVAGVKANVDTQRRAVKDSELKQRRNRRGRWSKS
jgi:hypothetical protein